MSDLFAIWLAIVSSVFALAVVTGVSCSFAKADTARRINELMDAHERNLTSSDHETVAESIRRWKTMCRKFQSGDPRHAMLWMNLERWGDKRAGRHHIPDAGKMVENRTNHDAVPEARAYADGGHRHWFPKVTSEPPPAPPAITEGSSKGNYKRDYFREMPKGPPPALQPKPTLTDSERGAIEQAIDAANGMILAEPWAIETLRKLLERLQ